MDKWLIFCQNKKDEVEYQNCVKILLVNHPDALISISYSYGMSGEDSGIGITPKIFFHMKNELLMHTTSVHLKKVMLSK